MENVVELLDKYLEKLGMTAQQAYPYLVQYTFINGIRWMCMSLVFFVFAGIMFNYRRKCKDRYDSEARAAMFITGTALIILGILFVVDNAADVFTPETTTIYNLIQQLSRK